MFWMNNTFKIEVEFYFHILCPIFKKSNADKIYSQKKFHDCFCIMFRKTIHHIKQLTKVLLIQNGI